MNCTKIQRNLCKWMWVCMHFGLCHVWWVHGRSGIDCVFCVCIDLGSTLWPDVCIHILHTRLRAHVEYTYTHVHTHAYHKHACACTYRIRMCIQCVAVCCSTSSWDTWLGIGASCEHFNVGNLVCVMCVAVCCSALQSVNVSSLGQVMCCVVVCCSESCVVL